ncbi:MAG: hypothetical protein ABL907_05790 [Hyphomicrobium sp.]
MKSRARGLYPAEALISIAERVVAALQDAGAGHVRDVAIYFTVSDAVGREVKLGKADLEIDELKLDFQDLSHTLPEQRLAVMPPGKRQPSHQRPSQVRSRQREQ